jgi:hypothetical protein
VKSARHVPNRRPLGAARIVRHPHRSRRLFFRASRSTLADAAAAALLALVAVAARAAPADAVLLGAANAAQPA